MPFKEVTKSNLTAAGDAQRTARPLAARYEIKMNEHFNIVEGILFDLKKEYANSSSVEIVAPSAPITERDIVSEIYCRLKNFCRNADLYPHTEIKPAPSENAEPSKLRRLPKIDVAILKNLKTKTWISSATKIQNRYKKGLIESRFGSVPIEFFHTAIEVKIQSNVRDAKKDIDTLANILEQNKLCNCFMVLLNARGLKKDHLRIVQYAEQKSINLIEYTCN